MLKMRSEVEAGEDCFIPIISREGDDEQYLLFQAQSLRYEDEMKRTLNSLCYLPLRKAFDPSSTNCQKFHL